MCIDIFSPGYCIDVDILIEQIWLELYKETSGELKILEIYDFCITNRLGNKTLDRMWLLFPHNVTTKKDKEREIKIDIWLVNPANSKVHEKYEWAFTSATECVDEKEGIVVREYYGDPPSLGGGGSNALEGIALNGKIVFPEGFENDHIDVLTGSEICKSIVCVELDKPLDPGKKGWLRLAVNPQKLDLPPLKKRKIWNKIPEPFVFERSLSIACPMIVREKLHGKLADPSEELSANEYAICSKLLSNIFSGALLEDGTSTRIQDHRVALIAAEGIGIDDSTCTGEAEFMGIIPELEEQGYTTLLWACGSDRYPELDIIRNAINIIGKLYHEGSIEKKDLLRELAPHSKQEFFNRLLDNMESVGLVKFKDKWFLPEVDSQKVEDFLKGIQESPSLLDDERFTELRRKYTYSTLDDLLLHALLDFTDLHPFQIDYRIRWISISATLEERLKPLLDMLEWDDEQEGNKSENAIAK